MGTLACMVNLGGPAYPSDRIEVSTGAVTEVESIMSTAAAQSDAASGQMTVTLTESQVTSYLVYKLQQQSPQDAVPITDPQVYLRDGEIQIYGKSITTYYSANVKIAVKLSVDAEGGLKIDITEADFGPIPVPAGLRQMVTNAIRDAYRNALGSAVTHFRLENVTTESGTITMTDKPKAGEDLWPIK